MRKVNNNGQLTKQMHNVFEKHKDRHINGFVWREEIIKDMVKLAGFNEEEVVEADDALSPDDHILYVLDTLHDHVVHMLKNFDAGKTKGNLILMQGYINGVANLIRGKAKDGLPNVTGNDEPTGDDIGGQDDTDSGDGENTPGHEEGDGSSTSE